MNKLVLLSAVLALQGFSAMGGTNALPPTGQSNPPPEQQGQKSVSKPTAAPAQGVLSRTTAARPQDIATTRRISREGLLKRRQPQKDYGAALESFFRSGNDQMGDVCVRDTVVTIFPTGR